MPGGPLLSEFHRGDATGGAQRPNRKPAASDKLHTPAEMSEAEPRRIKTDQDVTPRQWDGTHASSATPPSDPRHQRREGVEGGSACTHALRQDGSGEVVTKGPHTILPIHIRDITHTHAFSEETKTLGCGQPASLRLR